MKLLYSRLVFAYILLFLNIFCLVSYGQTHSQQLETILQSLHSMQASFVQTGSIIGEMYLQRPGKFRWEIIKPYQQLIIVNGKIIWIYDKELQQVIKRKVDYSRPDNPAVLLSGSIGKIQDNFSISVIHKTNTVIIFKLTPNKDNNVFEEIILKFAGNKLEEMQILDKLQKRTSFIFSQIKINQPLAQSLFNFVPPAGVDVVAE